MEGPPNHPKTFGEELQRLRESAGLSLEDIAKETKISRQILSCLETGDFRFLPQKVFSRNFVIQYANVVGADPNRVGEAFEAALKEGGPVLLEPIMKVEVVTPEDYMGDVMGDLNRRRGIVQGMDDSPSGKIIRAEVPLAEMFGYATDLRSATQGRATYSMEFAEYAEAPASVAEAIIKKVS